MNRRVARAGIDWLGALAGDLRVGFCALDRLRPCFSPRVPAHQEQPGQRGGDEDGIGVLGQAAIAHLGEAEYPLDHTEDTFDPGADPGLGPVRGPIGGGQRAIPTALALGEVAGVGSGLVNDLFLSRMGQIAMIPLLMAVEKIGQPPAVVHVGPANRDRIDQPDLAIGSNMRLHPEIPLIALTGLPHLRVAIAL